MTTADRDRWNDRYSDRNSHVVPAPPDAVVEASLTESFPVHGRALDVACGLGAGSIWMAQRGLDVIALDVSGEALRRVGFAAREHGVSDRVTTVASDLDDGLPDESPLFDVIVCQRFRDPSLYGQFLDRLRPGGLLVVTVLSQTGATDPGPFHAPPGELRAAFSHDDCIVLHSHQGDGEESIILEHKA